MEQTVLQPSSLFVSFADTLAVPSLAPFLAARRCAHPSGGVIKSLSSWKDASVEQLNSTNQAQLWTTVSPQPTWVSPPEVVDLTLDEDGGHKLLL